MNRVLKTETNHNQNSLKNVHQNLIEETIQSSFQRRASWWCIRFNEAIQPGMARQLDQFFKKFTPSVVYGEDRVFLDLRTVNKRLSFGLFQGKLASIAEGMELNFDQWQFGAGNSMAEAWVQTRWGTLATDILPIEALLDYASPLGTDRKENGRIKHLKSLRAHGISMMQDLIEMPEDHLLSRTGLWVDEVCREHFSRPETLRDEWLEKTTVDSLTQSNSLSFQLDDWIPSEYMDVA